jgi:hypothetical protein
MEEQDAEHTVDSVAVAWVEAAEEAAVEEDKMRSK